MYKIQKLNLGKKWLINKRKTLQFQAISPLKMIVTTAVSFEQQVYILKQTLIPKLYHCV